MDAHPIPQNVTTFQFHLVGDMTLKQFGYLAVGLIIAYIMFVFFAANYPLLAWPLIGLSSLAGVAFAFVPFASRPLDYWLVAFLKAVYSPTKRIWKRNGQNYQQDPLFRSRLLMFFPSNQPAPTPPPQAPLPTPIRKETSPQPTLSPVNVPPPPSAAPTEPLPSQEELGKTVELARQAQSLQVQIIQTERQLNQLKAQATQSPQNSQAYSQQVNIILEELQELVTQAAAIKQQIETIQQPEPFLSTKPTTVPRPKLKIKIAVPVKPKQTQLALTTFPNVINGIVKDSQGNYLDGVVVVIYDKEGLPVRALKTNKLGQFSGSTPLPNGTYNVEVEKEGFSFDLLQIELEGQLIPPLAIAAKP